MTRRRRRRWPPPSSCARVVLLVIMANWCSTAMRSIITGAPWPLQWWSSDPLKGSGSLRVDQSMMMVGGVAGPPPFLLLVDAYQPENRQVIFPPPGMTRIEREKFIATHRRERKARQYRQWLAHWESQPQRERRQDCDAMGNCVYAGLQGSLQNGMGLVFCADCPDPHAAGSYMEVWEMFHHPEGYHVHGEIIFGVPNDGSAPMMNTVGGTIVLFHRGNVPFVTKVRHAQDAGAAAVVIIDDGQCSEDFDCGRWLGSRSDGYLAAKDNPEDWEGVYIPSVLITQAQSQRLVQLLELTVCNLDEFGDQVYVPE